MTISFLGFVVLSYGSNWNKSFNLPVLYFSLGDNIAFYSFLF